MDDQFTRIELARPFIEQCHREIELAWLQIEAAKEVLTRGRWLLARWAEQSRAKTSNCIASPRPSDRSEAARMGMFVTLRPAAQPRRKPPTRSYRGDASRTGTISRIE
jgi:hypothetical protein